MKTKTAYMCVCICILTLLTGFANSAELEKPNIVIVLADDASPQYYTPAVAPNLDYIANKGIRFTRAYAASICAASRYLLMTGKFGRETGAYHNRFSDFLRNDVNQNLTLAGMFKEAGYTTGYFGKWGMYGALNNYDKRVVWEVAYKGTAMEDPHTSSRYWHPAISEDGQMLNTTPSDYGPDIYVNKIIQFMEDNKSVPYTVHYGMVDPHAVRDHEWPKMPDVAQAPPSDKGRYLDTIRYGDVLLGKIIRKLEESPRPFILIFASDNATAKEGKQEPTVKGCHVVFNVYGTDIAARGASSALISFADVMPTLAAFAGYPTVPATAGYDLSSYWRGDYHYTRSYVYSNIGTSNVYVSDRYSIEELDFVRNKPDGTFFKGRKRVNENGQYRRMVRYGEQVNGKPLKASSRLFKSKQGKAFLDFWIKLGEKTPK